MGVAKLPFDGFDLHYELRGDGPKTVVLSHSFLTDLHQYEHQIDVLARHFRVLAFDWRGHGQSGCPDGTFDLEDLYQDAVALLDGLGIDRAHWVGLSTGGFIGMRLTVRIPERIDRLVLMNTSAGPEPTLQRLKYEGFFAVLKVAGYGPVVGEGMKAMFGDTYLRDPNRAEQLEHWKSKITAMKIDRLVRFGRAIFGRPDFLPSLVHVRAPTLVAGGEEDRATPPSCSRSIARAVPGAELHILPDTGHLSTIERPEDTAQLLDRFLSK